MVANLNIVFLIIVFSALEFIFCCNSDRCLPPSIINGYFTTESAHSIIFHCRYNFTLVGKRNNVCVCSRWIHSTPLCVHNNVYKIPECSAPYIQKGWVECLTVGCNRFYVGTEAAIRCEKGYQLIGSSRLQCRYRDEASFQIAAWNTQVPKCIPIEGEYSEFSQQGPSLNIFYNENSSIMVIIIILSVLACGLMLLISAMLMNRLVKRRRQIRFQRSDISFTNGRNTAPVSNVIEDHCEENQVERNTSVQGTNRWNCFSRSNSRYQHMETQATENNAVTDHDCTPVETPELYNHSICSDDRASLINPPCYEEAIKCSQYSIVVPPHANVSLTSRENKKSKLDSSKREKLKHLPIRSAISSISNDTTIVNQPETSQPNSSMNSTDVISHSTIENTNSIQSANSYRSNDIDNISRRSTRVHYNRIVNNISAESNNSFMSGSIETMAVSDGTSVTVHTFDSNGSNPSIGSMRPQTGSIGDPTNFNNSRHSSSRYTNNVGRLAESDFPDIHTSQRYSPPPSYESSINSQKLLKSNRSCRSNTGSPSTCSNIALFVDNMACTNEPDDIPT